MPRIPKRHRRLARRGNKLLLAMSNGVRNCIAIEGRFEETTSIGADTLLWSANGSVSRQSIFVEGEEKIQAQFWQGMTVRYEVVSVHYTRENIYEIATSDSPAHDSIYDPEKQRWCFFETYRGMGRSSYHRDGGTFPLSGNIIEPLDEQREGYWEVTVTWVSEDAPGIGTEWTMLKIEDEYGNGVQNPQGFSVSAQPSPVLIHHDGETQWEELDDEDFLHDVDF